MKKEKNEKNKSKQRKKGSVTLCAFAIKKKNCSCERKASQNGVSLANTRDAFKQGKAESGRKERL